MCGIVMYGSRSPGSFEMDYFERALICDTFRGYHSTGAFVGYKDPDDAAPIVVYHKQIGEGWNFVESDEWKNIRHVERKSFPTATTNTKYYPTFAVGHNRHATMGAKTAENAHPFQHGDVTLVHNGTMDDVFLLVDNQKFTVDSENICYAINKQGIAETIKQMDGAYTLIWHDARDNTLNILRNEERPFHLVETSTGDWLGASEEDMLLWLYGRNKYNIVNKYVPAMKRHFECEVGVQYVFDVANGNFALKEEIKHELPTFLPRRSYGYGYGYGYDYSYGGYGYSSTSRPTTNLEDKREEKKTTTPSHSFKKVDDIIQNDAGLKHLQKGSVVNFLAFQYNGYPNNKEGRGKLTGMIENHEHYVEVHAHYFAEEDFIDMGYFFGVIKSAFNDNGVVTLIVDEVSLEDPRLKEAEASDDAEEAEAEEVKQAADGVCYTQAEWEKSSASDCGWCSNKIPFAAIGSASVFMESFICCDCYDEVNAEMALDGLTIAGRDLSDLDLSEDDEDDEVPFDVAEPAGTFVCQNCAREKEDSQESPRKFCCNECYKAYYSVTDMKKVLKNGMIVDYTNWNKINTCFDCKKPVPWTDADKVMFNGAGTQPICLDCLSKLI